MAREVAILSDGDGMQAGGNGEDKRIPDLPLLPPPSETAGSHPYIHDLTTTSGSWRLVRAYSVPIATPHCRRRQWLGIFDEGGMQRKTWFTWSQMNGGVHTAIAHQASRSSQHGDPDLVSTLEYSVTLWVGVSTYC